MNGTCRCSSIQTERVCDITVWIAVRTIELYAAELPFVAGVEVDGDAALAEPVHLIAQIDIPE